MVDTSLGYVPEMPEKPRPNKEVRSQILVMIKGGASYHIDSSDEVTTRGVFDSADYSVSYPEEVLRLLSTPDRWLDLWVDGENEKGERTRIGVRLFGCNVMHLTQAFVFPAGEDMVQA